ncbi:uncharacterized protein LOC129756909 [Uranotaenia lowii]|uniref:uncharacterized protein LOC129755525 n=1 Tax=Uranotaenia lowii TaxID=190385 RepID=UPI0024786A1F|nr:uncharacterized protein LOC129755525 [Uranotaenia lowii]XP_055609940.1 uncharacterized protein LOC129756909 [Uranotaenia lowii]
MAELKIESDRGDDDLSDQFEIEDPVLDAGLNPDEESDEDDPVNYVSEEVLLFVDFDNHLSRKELVDPNVRIKVVGIETEHPVIQINEDVYKGTYDYPLGTNVFLEEDPFEKSKIDPLYGANPDKLYKYAGQSDKMLKMKRIFVKPKEQQPSTATIKEEPGSLPVPATELDKVCRFTERTLVTRTYEEALNLHLPEGHYPPRHIAPEQNCGKVVARKMAALTAVDSDIEDEAAKADDPNDRDYQPGVI